MPEITKEFSGSHIQVSADDAIEKIGAAILKCEGRHQRVGIPANTVICLTAMDLIALKASRSDIYRSHPDFGDVYLSPKVPLAVHMSQMGALSVYTDTQFTYALNREGQIRHFEPNPGLVGGTSKRIGVIKALDLDGVRLYRASDFPGTRGFKAEGASGFLTGNTRKHENETYHEIHLIYFPHYDDDVGQLFYAKAAAVLLAPAERWIQWGDEVLQL